MHICFLTNKYPNDVEPNALVFLEQLVNEIAFQGEKCTVICPVPVNLNSKFKSLDYHYEKVLENGRTVNIYFPRYYSLGQTNYWKFNPARITTALFAKAVDKVINSNLNINEIDAFYGHFVTPAGIAAARLGKKYNIPSYLAYGEATFGTIEHFGKNAVRKELKELSGVIAVSSQNKEMIEEFVPNGITKVFPNSIDENVFVPQDRKKSRQKFGIADSRFTIAFVGSFDERKGINRLSDAVDSIDAECCLICAGKGDLLPKTNKCIIKEPVLHSELPYFLSAADIFVLPTQHEGCCNAIIEAMACGLPIVSSDRSFNDDILNDKNSIRIDSDSVNGIREAILKLMNNPEVCEEMKKASLQKAKELTLSNRARNILEFMRENNDFKK